MALDPDDPSAPALALYGYLSWLQEQAVEALSADVCSGETRVYGSTSTRPAGSSRLACTASSIALEREDLPEQRRQLEPARRDVLEQDRQRDGGILRAVHRPREELLAAEELARVEVEPQPGRRQPDHHGRAAAAGEAQRRRARLREADGVEAVVGALGRDRRHRLLEVVGMHARASRRAGAPARGATRPGRRRRSPRRRRSARPGRRTGRRRPHRSRARRRRARRAPRTAPRRRPSARRSRAAPHRAAAPRRPSATRPARRRRRARPRRPSPCRGTPSRRRATSPSCRRRASRCRSRDGAARRRRAGRGRSRRSGRTTAPTRARPRPRRAPSRPRRPTCSTIAGALVAEHHRRRPLPLALDLVQVGAADADRRHADDDVVRAGLRQVELDDLERLADCPEEPGPRLHRRLAPIAAFTAAQLVTWETFWSA